jgi:hypothetical protein
MVLWHFLIRGIEILLCEMEFFRKLELLTFSIHYTICWRAEDSVITFFLFQRTGSVFSVSSVVHFLFLLQRLAHTRASRR